ncbi:MAG: hypothetical protein DRJ40_06305 [Thermoprotei archaeon]|nr:MAG: hypothetical protein DRJ40_06305 [Thermoprotei archaeon]
MHEQSKHFISIHKDCCKVKCSNAQILHKPDQEWGRGCDLVLRHTREGKTTLILCEVKGGTLNPDDLDDVVNQLEYTEQVLRKKYSSVRTVKVFIHCGGGRVPSYVPQVLRRNSIFFAKSHEDIAELV